MAGSSTDHLDGDIYPLMATEKCGFYQRGDKLISYSLTPGYETYQGLGWYGCIETRISG